jgi:phosphomannomutase
MAKVVLREGKKRGILSDISSSKIVEDTVKINGGNFYFSKTGHSFIKPIMAKKNVYFGGEKSAHYYLGKNNNFETPLFVLFKIIEEVSEKKRPLSEIIAPFKKYINSGEINFEIEDRESALKGVEEYFRNKDCKISKLDGIKAEGKDFWCLVRPSNTEPLLRMIVEAKNEEILKQEIEEIKKIILSFN